MLRFIGIREIKIIRMEQMKKLLIPFAVCLSLSLISVQASSTMELGIGETAYKTIRENIQNGELMAAPYVENDRTLVPLRVISEEFGALVSWDDALQEATIEKDGNVVKVAIGAGIASVNGEEKPLDTPAVLFEDSITMVPIRFISENLGYSVDYVSGLEKIVITDKPAVMKVGGREVGFDDFLYYYRINQGMIPEESETVTAERVEQAKNDLKAQLVSMFREFYTIYNQAEESGFLQLTQNPEFNAQLKQNIDKYLPYEADYGILSGVVGGLEIKNQVATTYLNIMQSSVQPSEDEISAFYNENFVTAKHILIPTVDLDTREPLSEKEQAQALKTANDLSARIKKGEDFDKLMKEYSKDTGLAQYPEGYTFTKGEMVEEFTNAAYALEEGAVSEPVKSVFGYHIVKRLPIEPLAAALTQDISAFLQQKNASEFVQGLLDKSEVLINQEALGLIN